MALRSSSGGRPTPRAAAHSPLRNPPQPAVRAPPPAHVQGGNGSLMGTIVDGLALGTRISIAHRAADAVLGPRVIQHETVPSSDPAAGSAPKMNSSADACTGQSQALQECLSNYGSDISKCQFYMDEVQECRKSSSSGASLSA